MSFFEHTANFPEIVKYLAFISYTEFKNAKKKENLRLILPRRNTTQRIIYNNIMTLRTRFTGHLPEQLLKLSRIINVQALPT